MTSRAAASRMPALDGLRGIAILMVIVFHHSLFDAGWVGVQLFFVISGFLITSNLLRDRALAARPFFAGFYWRRSLRIFPVYFAYVGFLALLCATTTKASELRVYWPYLVTYTYNLTHLSSHFVFSFWFGHFWSLCIEEQFYLIWPMVVYLLPPKHLQWAVVGMIAGAPVCRGLTALALSRHLSSAYDVGDAVYWFTPSQMDAFAFGASVAVFRWSERLRRPLAWLGAAAATTVVLGLGNLSMLARSIRDEQSWTSFGYPLGGIADAQHVWSYTVLNLTCALFVLCAVQRRLALLENTWLTHVGRTSYAAYVVHRAVILFVKSELARFNYRGTVADRALLLCISLPVILAIAAISYRWFEQHLMNLRAGTDRPPIGLPREPRKNESTSNLR